MKGGATGTRGTLGRMAPWRHWARRLGRWALNVATVASLVLCLAVGALWVRSYWWYDTCSRAVFRPGPGAAPEFRWTAWESDRGRLIWEFHRLRDSHGIMLVVGVNDPPVWEWKAEPADPYRWERGRGILDCRWGPIRWTSSENPASTADQYYRAIAIPHWLSVATCAVVPAARALGWGRRRRHLRRLALGGLCPTCSYDLRATPGRCSECGWKGSRAGAG